MNFVPVDVDGVEPTTEAPEGISDVSGNPRFRTWSLDEAEGGLYAGIWETTPGKWRFTNLHWEYCRVISGMSVITEDGGQSRTVKAGDSFVLRAGFSGTWEAIETTRKDYVIRAAL